MKYFPLPLKVLVIPNSHEFQHSAEVENFPFWCIFIWHPDLRVCHISAEDSQTYFCIHKSHELKHSAEVENFSHWWLFLTSAPTSVPNSGPPRQSDNFSTLVKNYPLKKIKKRKFQKPMKITWIGTLCKGEKFST